MFRQHVLLTILWACGLAETLSAQVPAKIDFGRDVLPIFQQRCVGCHGPSQQMNGLRLDRRSSVFKAGARRIVPGSSENSFLYHRLIGNEYGLQMPPTGALRAEQINTIRAWIDEGAEWPDAVANEADSTPLNPKAVSMVEALRTGDRRSFMKSVAEDPKLLNARGPEGSTPFMYAVLYTDAAMLEQLLKKGADPNARNDAKATALMWAASDFQKTRVLLVHGADGNARSDDLRTPLMIASGHPGGAPIVKLLLDHGADLNPKPSEVQALLVEAATAGDAETLELLISRGADVKVAGAPPLIFAAQAGCSKCVDILTARLDAAGFKLGAEAFFALPVVSALGDVRLVRWMLDHGTDVNAVDPLGRTPLMYAAVSDFLPVDAVTLLIERGANVNAKSRHPQSGDSGRTALDLAKLHGNTPVADALIKAGATTTEPSEPVLKPQRASSIQAAIERSIPLLQRTDANFIPKAGCVSCHNNSFQAMASGLARKSGIRVDEQISRQQVKANASYIEQKRDLLHQGWFFGGARIDPGISSLILIGLDAEHYPADLNTDAVAMYLQTRQMPDGRWAFGTDGRPPVCPDGDVEQTAVSMRAIQLYAPKVNKALYQRSIDLAAQWLTSAQPRTDTERLWRLIGLAWAGKPKTAIQKATRDVLAIQRSDGGWSDLPSMDSTALATGLALVALQAAGLSVSDSAYQRGVQFLLNTQMEDGSWYMKTRAAGFQPYFDNGFPYGVDQWISAAGTTWATMALALASEPPAKSASVNVR